MFKSIRLNLTLYFAIILAFILIVGSYLLYENAYTNRISNLDGSLSVIVADTAVDMMEENEERKLNVQEIDEDSNEIEEQLKINILHLRIIEYDFATQRLKVLMRSSKTKNSIFDNWDIKKDMQEHKVYYKTFQKYRLAMDIVKLDSEKIRAVQTAVLISSEDESLSHTLLILISVNFVIFIFSVISAYLLISRTLLPVHNIVTAVNEIEAYDYNKRISIADVPNEIKELVDTFNELLSRHKESFNKISQFSSDASHELKTPLTIMRGEIEVWLRKVRTKEEYQMVLKDMLSEIIKIQHLIDGLLFLAKSDKLEIQKRFEEVYLDEVITDCVEELKNYAQSKSIIVEIEHLIPLTSRGNVTLLKIACLNLLKNAIDYSPKNSKVKVYINKNNNHYVLGIQDQGIGIAREDLKYIFDRFYRTKNSKLRSSGGIGLGLSIVKMILDIHEFDILFDSKIQKGTLVEIFIL